MHLPDVELHRCETLDDASAVMVRHAGQARILAGGTDVLVDLKTGRVTARHLVSINRITSLRGVSLVPEGLRIGALTTIMQLHRAPLVRGEFSPILDATAELAAPPIRNLATVGGNIASGVPCADMPPILIAMHASAMIWSPNGPRRVSLDRFFIGPRQTALGGDEVLEGVIVPTPPAGAGSAYARFGLREGNAVAVASVAVGIRLDPSGVIGDARIVLGAVAPVPMRAESAERVLRGRPPDASAFADAARAAVQVASPISDVRGSADFRREIVGVLARRALGTALARAMESAS